MANNFVHGFMNSEVVPPFTLNGTRFDQATYMGRLRHFVLERAKSVINSFKPGEDAPANTERSKELWEAKRIVDSAVNHATGEVIHPMARMCSFVPASVPITLGMLSFTSTTSVVMLQWLNQSYNALFNYSHRSGKESSNGEILKAYAIATATSCGLALGLNRFSNRIRPAFLIPTLAVMAAGAANVGFTRGNEIRDGINVYDEKGEVLGVSKKAGWYAVWYTILSRNFFLPIPIMVVPGYLSQWILNNRRSSIPASPRFKLMLNLGCIVLSQTIALPICIALFPSTLKIRASELESELLEKLRGNEYVFVNKGV